jgi:hypothetical protein
MGLTAPLLRLCLHSVDQSRPQTRSSCSRIAWSPPVFVVNDSLFSARSFSFYSLLSRHTTILLDSGGTVKGSPIRPPQCGLPRNVSRSASTMNSYGAVSIFGSLRDSLRSEWFPVYASLMLFRHPSHPWVVRFFVGHAVSSANFNDLANMSAKLGNYFWLGFIIMGLSPNKKRHALHGAQRRSPPTPCPGARLRLQVEG